MTLGDNSQLQVSLLFFGLVSLFLTTITFAISGLALLAMLVLAFNLAVLLWIAWLAATTWRITATSYQLTLINALGQKIVIPGHDFSSIIPIDNAMLFSRRRYQILLKDGRTFPFMHPTTLLGIFLSDSLTHTSKELTSRVRAAIGVQ